MLALAQKPPSPVGPRPRNIWSHAACLASKRPRASRSETDRPLAGISDLLTPVDGLVAAVGLPVNWPAVAAQVRTVAAAPVVPTRSSRPGSALKRREEFPHVLLLLLFLRSIYAQSISRKKALRPLCARRRCRRRAIPDDGSDQACDAWQAERRQPLRPCSTQRVEVALPQQCGMSTASGR